MLYKTLILTILVHYTLSKRILITVCCVNVVACHLNLISKGMSHHQFMLQDLCKFSVHHLTINTTNPTTVSVVC